MIMRYEREFGRKGAGVSETGGLRGQKMRIIKVVKTGEN